MSRGRRFTSHESYLKQQWTGAEQCDAHKKPLTLMEYPTRSGMVDALSDLLIFGIPSFGYEGSDHIFNPDEETRNFSENHRVNDAYVVGYPNEAKSRHVYIKRCAEKKLSDWLRFHRGVISEKYYLRPGYYNPAQMAETLLTKPGAHLPRLYEELINNPHYDFKVYAEKLTEFCTEFIGIFNQTSIPIKVLKAVDARCHFCPTGSDARTCRVNGSLAWFYLMTPILKEESNGTEFIFSGSREELNEYLFGIYRKYCPFDRQGHPLSGVSIIDWASADACFPVQKTDMGNEKEEQSPVTGKGNKQSGMTPEPSLYREQKYLRHQVVLLRKQNALLTNLLEAKNDK
ncbi:hypothetical protein [Citrobacter sp. TBCS-14]|uniref:hypothetical protein n=1 Tax=Citrobacter sp. TBCS-14 TaxID=2576409 RepID=UPI00113C3BA3|nr:hypothetical protein [Citrobacter sp. TBCS-14]TKU68820.1 hypothetical protein FDX22_28605 [Citrobacter sp. TBCS-14]